MDGIRLVTCGPAKRMIFYSIRTGCQLPPNDFNSIRTGCKLKLYDVQQYVYGPAYYYQQPAHYHTYHSAQSVRTGVVIDDLHRTIIMH
jgi:hypothetical protein